MPRRKGNGHIGRCAVLMTIGIDEEGRLCVLVVEVANVESAGSDSSLHPAIVLHYESRRVREGATKREFLAALQPIPHVVEVLPQLEPCDLQIA